MEANLFYTTDTKDSYLLSIMTKSQWEQSLEDNRLTEANYFTAQQFQARLGDTCIIYNQEGKINKVYIGGGENRQELALAHAATRLPPGTYHLQQELSPTAYVIWSLAQYRFLDFKKHTTEARILVLPSQKELSSVLAEASAIFLVRDLINKPANALSPEDLAHVCEDLAKKYDAHFEQWVGNELLEHNFPAIHAVGRASDKAPRLLSLQWGNEHDPRVTLVGKGVCFDSGGLDLKPSVSMRLMKKDMGGAASVIGLAQWIMTRKLPIRLHVLIPAVENAMGPNAFKPGDVLTMRNGLTVEIDNTDAEGRLILADTMVKAAEEEPELLIDFATLTGAARVALGPDIATMFTNNDEVAQSLVESSQAVHDPLWRLPLFSEYESLLNSPIADIANSSNSPYAGAITAALFLQRFIPTSLPWVHFDIMAWNLSTKAGKPEGGEATGWRAVMYYLLKRFAT